MKSFLPFLFLLSLACGCENKADLQTGKFIEDTTAYHNIFIGRLAGHRFIDTNVKNIIVIGDFEPQEELKLVYHNYQILIKWDWKYFDTVNGKILKRNLQKLIADIPNNETLLKQRFEFIHNKLLQYWLDDINTWYEKQKGINQ